MCRWIPALQSFELGPEYSGKEATKREGKVARKSGRGKERMRGFWLLLIPSILRSLGVIFVPSEEP